MADVDPRLVRAIRALDAERQLRLKAEQRERALRLQLSNARRRLGMVSRTTDGKPAENSR